MEIKNLSLSFGTQQIFRDANVYIPDNEKVGIVGVNGAGKTTLFKLILGKESPDDGNIVVRKGARIGWLPQVFEDDLSDLDMTVFEYLKTGRPIDMLENRLQKLYDSLSDPNVNMDAVFKKIDLTNDLLQYWDLNTAESELLKIIYGIGITNEMLNKKVNELSGGQKSKVAFARLLYSKPELLLLDEPTNHMDVESKEFITNFLKKYRGTVLVISHDVEFLDEITTKTLFIDKRVHNMKLFDGNYSNFCRLESEYEEKIRREAQKQQAEEDKLRAIINKYATASGNRKRMAQDREKKLERLLENKIEMLEPSKKADIKIQMNTDINNIPLSVNNLHFRYTPEGPQIIKNLSFSIYKGEKFLVLGKNGAGKSTLLKLLNNILVPDSGNINIGSKVKIGYYAQEFENLDDHLTIIDNFHNALPMSKMRSILAKFLFFGDDVYKKVGVLSPGEKARVALVKLSIADANLLLLDEPTNHLDPDTQQIIGEVFSDFPGSMIVVSHNVDFVKKLGIERVLILPTGKIDYYDDSLVDYYSELDQKTKTKGKKK